MSQQLQELLQEWREDPLKFVMDNFGKGFPEGGGPDAWQKQFLSALVTHNRIAGTASKGPGKTCCLAWACWWFLACFPKSNIAAVSINADNLRDGLWKEMAKWAFFSPLLMSQFEITKTRIQANDAPHEWWMSARAYSKAADSNQQADTLAGLHSDYMMFVIDEAGGVPDAVGAAAEAAIATEGGKKLFVLMGNPTTRGGPLWRANTSERDLWVNIRINGDPDNPNRSSRVNKKWAQDQINKYGRESAFVKVNVFGEFPETSLNALLGSADVQAAFRRRFDQDAVDMAQKRIGVDVARFGDDRTVIQRRQGVLALAPLEFRGLRSNEVAARVAQVSSEWGAELIFVDDTGGHGGGVVDSLIQAGLSPIPINFSSKPLDPRYLNKRAEMWFLMSEWVKDRGVLPENHELAMELSSPIYDFSGGKFKLESKDDIKSRIGFSPDVADALALTFALPELPGRNSLQGMKSVMSGAIKKEWDPFDPGRP